MALIFTIFFILMVILVIAFVNFDKLVKIEYTKYRKDWIKDGKPRGFFWWPPERTLFSSSLALQALSLKWLFKTPQWMNSDAVAIQRLKRLRLSVLTFYVGIIVWFIISMIIK
jgi:hypothetical protein